MNLVWNAFVSFANLFLSLFDDRLFNDFIIPTMLYFINFSYFEIKLVYLTWRNRHIANFNNEAEQNYFLRQKFLKFYLIFCILLFNYLDMVVLLSFIFVYNIFFKKPFIIIMTALTWAFQILYNLRRGKKCKVYLLSILIISINRIFIPVYIYITIALFQNVPSELFGDACRWSFQ